MISNTKEEFIEKKNVESYGEKTEGLGTYTETKKDQANFKKDLKLEKIMLINNEPNS